MGPVERGFDKIEEDAEAQRRRTRFVNQSQAERSRASERFVNQPPVQSGPPARYVGVANSHERVRVSTVIAPSRVVEEVAVHTIETALDIDPVITVGRLVWQACAEPPKRPEDNRSS